MVYNSRLQTRVTHGRHETSSLRLQLLGNGDILSLDKTEAFITAAASLTAYTYTQGAELQCKMSTCSPLTTFGPTLQQKQHMLGVSCNTSLRAFKQALQLG